MRFTRRKLGIMLVLAGAAVPLAFVSAAYACGILATLHLNHRAVSSGATVSAIGGNYSSKPTSSAVVLRFNSRTGAVLWSGRPDANGGIQSTFTAPNAKPGYYLIDATQTLASGAPVAGTPGRAVLRIGRPSASSRRAVVALWPSATPGPGAGSHATGANTVAGFASGGGALVALFSAVLLAGGVLVLRDDRRRGRRSAPAV